MKTYESGDLVLTITDNPDWFTLKTKGIGTCFVSLPLEKLVNILSVADSAVEDRLLAFDFDMEYEEKCDHFPVKLAKGGKRCYKCGATEGTPEYKLGART